MNFRTYQDVLGENLQQLRRDQGLRQDDLAGLARSRGLAWTQQTVAAIEAGRRALSVGELLILQGLLAVPLLKLLPGLLTTDDEAVDVDGAILSADALQALAKGQAILPDEPGALLRALWPEEYGGDLGAAAALARRDRQLFDRYGVAVDDAPAVTAAEHGDAERKAARQLNVRPLEVAVASWSLWRHSLTDERDQRLDEQDSEGGERQRRGHITRQLLDELRQRIRDARRRKTTRRTK